MVLEIGRNAGKVLVVPGRHCTVVEGRGSSRDGRDSKSVLFDVGFYSNFESNRTYVIIVELEFDEYSPCPIITLKGQGHWGYMARGVLAKTI